LIQFLQLLRNANLMELFDDSVQQLTVVSKVNWQHQQL